MCRRVLRCLCGAASCRQIQSKASPSSADGFRRRGHRDGVVPAQGHLNQLLHLSLLLTSRGLPVHFAAPEPRLREVRTRLHGWGPTPRRCTSTRWMCPRTTPPPRTHPPRSRSTCSPCLRSSAPARGPREPRWRGGGGIGEERRQAVAGGCWRLGFLASGRDAACLMAVRDRTSGSDG